jgi:hypothetical protein
LPRSTIRRNETYRTYFFCFLIFILYNSFTFKNSKQLFDEFHAYFSEYAYSVSILEKIRKLNVILTLIISIIGLFGHLLTIFVFSQKRFRKNSSNIFLLCLAINDGFYLITHFFEDSIRTYVQINDFPNNQIHFNLIDQYNIACQLINYFRYILRTISAYTLISISIQRLIIVFSPFVNSFKSTRSAWFTMLFTTCVSLVINMWVPFYFEVTNLQKLNLDMGSNSSIFGSGIPNDSVRSCDVKKEFSNDYFNITVVYICLIMLLPILIILIANSLICYKIFYSKNEQNKLNESFFLARKNAKKKKENNNSLKLKNLVKLKPYYLNIDQVIKRVTNKANQTERLTKLLVLISFSYAFLNLPYFLTWSMYYIEINFNKEDVISHNYMYLAVEITEIFYIIHYSIHFYIYCLSGSVFRSQLRYSSIKINL